MSKKKVVWCSRCAINVYFKKTCIGWGREVVFLILLVGEKQKKNNKLKYTKKL
jgi:hypothetical protein